MTNNTSESFLQFKQTVEGINAETKLWLSGWSGLRLESVIFSRRSDGSFTWHAIRSMTVALRDKFPMKSSYRIKTFKTLNGAKRNFVRAHSHDIYWRSE